MHSYLYVFLPIFFNIYATPLCISFLLMLVPLHIWLFIYVLPSYPIFLKIPAYFAKRTCLLFITIYIYIQKWNNPAARSSKVKVIPHSFESASACFPWNLFLWTSCKIVILSSQLKPKSLITALLCREKSCWIISTLR